MSKKSKQRDCPALGRSITSLECATGRHHGISCPASCPHNPFSPACYDDLLALETRFDKRAVSALGDAIGPENLARLLALEKSRINEEQTAVSAKVIRALFLERDTADHSFAERWLASGSPALSNDERTLLACKARIRPALLEVREIHPDGHLRVVDLLDPQAGESILVDRMSWANAVRFQTLLVFSYPLPHYIRMFGGGLVWPEWSGLDLDPADCLAEIVAHAGGPAADAPDGARREWIGHHFMDVLERVHAVSDARNADMLAGLDIAWGWIEFELPAGASDPLGEKFAASPDTLPGEVEPDETAAGFVSALDWCDPADAGEKLLGRLLLGRVLRKGDTWRLVASNRARLARLRESFLTLAEIPGLAPVREYLQDLAKQEAARRPSPDDPRVPPRLRANPSLFEMSTRRLSQPVDDTRPVAENVSRFLDDANARWPDNPLPALGGRTPREAVRDPAARAQVIRMLKPRVFDADRKRLMGFPEPGPDDIIRELGLTEIDLPAPPDRPCPPQLADQAADLAARRRPLLFNPATTILSEEEVAQRVDAIYDRYTRDEDLLDAWNAACPGLAEMVAEHASEDLGVHDIESIVFGLALAWSILAGHATLPLGINLDHIRLAYADSVDRVALFEGNTAVSLFEKLHPTQPNVACATFAETGMRAQKLHKQKDIPRFTIELLIWLRAMLPAYENALARHARQ